MLGGPRKSEVAIESGATSTGRASLATRAGSAIGLPGPEHLDRRMRELLQEHRLGAVLACGSRPIIVVRHVLSVDEVVNERRAALLGAVLASVFDHGETLARLWGSAAAVLAARAGSSPAPPGPVKRVDLDDLDDLHDRHDLDNLEDRHDLDNLADLDDLVSALRIELRWAGLTGAPAHARIERHALPVDAAGLARLWRDLRTYSSSPASGGT